jgi:DNA (cytosine-5)-methyltransferase 1
VTTPAPRPVLIDLCCKAGGASVGYWRAGFDVIGIDNEPQPRYPFDLVERDITTLTADDLRRIALERLGRPLAAVVGSPPCKVHTALRHLARPEHVDLIPQTRALMRSTGLPYVIENVPGAPLESPLVLCGTEFGLSVEVEEGRRWLRRHRLFESNIPRRGAGGCSCSRRRPAIGVWGGGPTRPNGSRGGWSADSRQARRLLGIDWMVRNELSQAIPPAYTEHIGDQLIRYVAEAAA